MDKRVTVLLPNGRRQNLKITANMTLLEILETASAKHGYDSEEHCLKFHNKEVSLTQQFRFSGLPNNCMLEMEPTEKRRTLSNVVVCVQLSDGARSQAEFAPSCTVLQVVQQLYGSQLQRFESPVIIYMRSEVIGMEQMEQTTLKSLGIIEGRAMMRLIDKKPEELKTQANVYKPPVVKPKDIDDDEKPSTSRSAMADGGGGGGGGGGFALTSNMIKSLKRTAGDQNGSVNVTNETPKAHRDDNPEPTKPDWGGGSGYSMHQSRQQQSQLDEESEESAGQAPPVVNVVGARHAVIFSLDATRKNVDDLPDSFFDLTVNDLKMVLRDLKRTSSGNEDAPLLTAKLRELERQKNMLNKLNQYKDCVLRIQFPDRYVLQGIFKPYEKLERVMNWIREFLANPDKEFHLFTIPPKKVLPAEETLLELNFVPNAVLHFAFLEEALNTENHRFVQEKFIEQLTSEEGAHYAVMLYRTKMSPTKTSV